jgi:hypothetical protein
MVKNFFSLNLNYGDILKTFIMHLSVFESFYVCTQPSSGPDNTWGEVVGGAQQGIYSIHNDEQKTAIVDLLMEGTYLTGF